ncbi:hypothetical protein GQ457_05G018980 [Hibiscus cannabinus]
MALKIDLEKAYDKMCLPKDKGGMGFRDLRTFNRELIAKVGWRIVIKPYSSLSQMLRCIYFPNGNIFMLHNVITLLGLGMILEMVSKRSSKDHFGELIMKRVSL